MSRVAQADGTITGGEQAFIEGVATKLGLGPFVRGFGNEAGGGHGGGWTAPAHDEVADAYSTLGLAAGAPADEVKKAWRKLSLENHPDRATHLGEEFHRLAEERMRKINAAYQTLKSAGLAG